MNLVDLVKQANYLTSAGNYAEALNLHRDVIAAAPGYAPAYSDLGICLLHTGQAEEAKRVFQTAIFLAPKEALAYCNLGVAYNKEERHGEALAMFTYAAKLDPKLGVAYLNMGDSYTKLSMFDEAEAALEKSLRIDPTKVEALINMGTVQWGQGRLNAAIECFREAIKRDPENAFAHKNYGIVSLLRGDYETGWREYDWRLKSDVGHITYSGLPRWNGMDPGTVFVSTEQGIGDQILHASMANDIPYQNATIWEADKRLAPLLRRSFPRLIISQSDLLPADYHIPVASLGGLYRRRKDQFKGDAYLVPDTDKARSYRLRMDDKLKVGVSWASVGSQFSASKFVPLPNWMPVFEVPDVQLIDLQYGGSANDRAGAPINNFPDVDAFNDLDSLASLITACDLVITVSNTTAHLAGALGKETWVLVPSGYGKFWYWGDVGETTPWYKSVRLIRQRKRDSWADVMQQVAHRLRSRNAS